jgi:hypothetical protein
LIRSIPMSDITAVHASFDSKNYFIGFKDGNIKKFSSSKFVQET